MIFSTYQFVLLFLPIVFAGYYILNRFKFINLAKIWLILASLFFYSQGSPDFFPFFMASIFGNYIVGTTLGRLHHENRHREKKILMLVGVLANVGLLGYYKYTDFFIENVNAVAGTDFTLKRIILPIVISFFTYQSIAFLFSSY